MREELKPCVCDEEGSVLLCSKCYGIRTKAHLLLDEEEVAEYLRIAGLVRKSLAEVIAKAICSRFGRSEIKIPKEKEICGDLDTCAFNNGWNACIAKTAELNGRGEK